MRDHEYYAHAFVLLDKANGVKNYLEFKELVSVFKDSPKFIDALLFNREYFKEFEEEFKASFSTVIYNFLEIIIQDGFIEKLLDIEDEIRNVLVKNELYNYCVIESSDQLSDNMVSKMTEMINKRTDNNVEIVRKINKKLKSGIRVYLNNESIDLSIVGRLERLLSEVS